MTNTARSPSPDTALATELIDCVAGVNGREKRGSEGGTFFLAFFFVPTLLDSPLVLQQSSLVRILCLVST